MVHANYVIHMRHALCCCLCFWVSWYMPYKIKGKFVAKLPENTKDIKSQGFTPSAEALQLISSRREPLNSRAS